MLTKLPMVSVVIVTWNNEEDIKVCLDSLLHQLYPNYNITVVDNASTDKTVEIIKDKYSEKVELIELKENIMLTGGNNLGIKHVIDKHDPEFVMVLNADTKLEPKLIAELVNVMSKDKKVGAVGPKVKFFNNKNEGKINSAGLLYDGFMQAYDIGFEEEDNGQFDAMWEVFGVSGVCILYRAKMLKEIGLYYEPIKLYLDEVEMFIRTNKAGWKAIYDGLVTIWHSYMRSTDANKLVNIEKQKMRAWTLIALRHYPLKSKLAMIWKYIKFNLKNN